MRRILVISFTNLNHDARVSRQLTFLQGVGRLTVACLEVGESEHYSIIRLIPPRLTLSRKIISGFLLLLRWYDQAYNLLYPYKSLASLNTEEFDLILANDIESLPLAFHIQKHARILFDAHEYAPRHFEEKLMWRIFFQGFNKDLCRRFIPKVDEMITINHGLAREYKKDYGIDPKILTNANFYVALEPSPVVKDRIRLVHHGAANPSRKLELMIQMMDHLDDRFTLDLILLTPPTANKKTKGYLDLLKEMILNKPRVKILPPVKSEEVVSAIHAYDMGVCFVPHINFNYSHGLPNKLFDFIQARLAIAVGPTEEIAGLVTTYHVGIVSDNFDPKNLAKYLNPLTTEQVDHFKKQAHHVAKELSAEKNKEILLGLVTRLLT